MSLTVLVAEIGKYNGTMSIDARFVAGPAGPAAGTE